MAVNGGMLLTLRYELHDHIPVERQTHVPWHDYVNLPDLVMIKHDREVTRVDMSAGSATQVARGSASIDDVGRRQPTLVVAAGTRSEFVMKDGTVQLIDEMRLRITEFTVGGQGPAAMPRELPASSGYTYAVEVSSDEAVAAGATEVRFSDPLIHYVENFLDFPVGEVVPVGFYDRERMAWVAAENGRVVGVLAVTSGIADLDVDGRGQPANADQLAALGIDDAERLHVANLYQPGQTLWRVPIAHLSPWDCNWPWGAPDDAVSPPAPTDDDNDRDDPCEIGLP
jgi:hypothetical protein